MQELEKILEEIEEGAHTFEILGRDVDFVAIDWVRDVIRKRLNDAEYPYIVEKDIESVPPASKEFLDECRSVAKKYGENDGWISVDEPPKKDYIAVFAVDKHDYYFVAVYDKEHGYRTNDVGADVDNIVAYRLFNQYRPERSDNHDGE